MAPFPETEPTVVITFFFGPCSICMEVLSCLVILILLLLLFLVEDYPSKNISLVNVLLSLIMKLLR